MKVTFVTRNMWGGGAERVISILAKKFIEQNIDCEIITINDEQVLYTLPKEICVHPIGIQSQNKLIDKVMRYKKLRGIIKESNPTIVLTLPEDIGIYVIPALLGLKIPVVVSERNNPWLMPWKRETRVLRRLFYPLASGLIFQTSQAANFFPKSIKEKGTGLQNPLDLQYLPAPWEGPYRKEIIGAGRLEKQKNFQMLIRAFAKFHEEYSDYKLIIYGEGSLRSELEILASSLLPKNSFSFPGKRKDILEGMKGASMFVLSSDYEGMPNVVLEAMAIGVPVISTDCPSGGPSELIKDGENGYLVPVGDIDSLNEAMKKLVSSEELAHKFGKNSRNVRGIYDSNIVVDKWVSYLNKVVEKESGK